MMWRVSTPAARARAAISRPKPLSVRRDTQHVERPSCARPQAVLSSAPPTCTSNDAACSTRWRPGGVRRTIASPNATTSGGMVTAASVGRLDVMDGDVRQRVGVAQLLLAAARREQHAQAHVLVLGRAELLEPVHLGGR